MKRLVSSVRISLARNVSGSFPGLSLGFIKVYICLINSEVNPLRPLEVLERKAQLKKDINFIKNPPIFQSRINARRDIYFPQHSIFPSECGVTEAL